MDVDSAGLVASLKAANPGLDVYSHEEVATVDAWKEALRDNASIGSDAHFAKNLLFKDKNNKLYLIVALDSTEIDVKALSQRLGLGKKQPRMAEPEVLSEVFRVPQGCLSPLALCRPSTRDVVLFVDEKMKSDSSHKFLFHPLQNDQSVAMSLQGVEDFLGGIGHEAVYVDFSIKDKDVKIDRDNPPDLKVYADKAKGYKGKTDEGKKDASAPPSSKKDKGKSSGKNKNKDGEAKGKKQQLGSHVDDVHMLLRELESEFGGFPEKLHKDLEMRLNGFKNTAYTRGYLAARAEVMAKIR